MTPTLSRFTRLAAAVALLLGAACEEGENKIPGDSKANPVAPVFLFLDISANKGSIRANQEINPVVLTVQARFADTGAPVADGTVVVLTASLGSFDSPGGPSTLNLELFGGVARVNFYPGGTVGTARIRAELQGVIDQIEIRITGEAVPPPTAAILSAATDKSVVLEADPSTDIEVSAIVLGSDAEPFRDAPVQFSSPLGTFASSEASSSEVLTTDSNGEVLDLLTISQAEVQAYGSDSFDITATLFTEGGGTTSVNIPITIVRADDPPTPTSIVLTASPTTVADDGSPHDVNLTAVVRDQNGTVMGGVDVTFSSELGSPSPATDTTDGSGTATSLLSLSAAEIAAFPSDTFDVEAVMGIIGGTASDTVTITIDRPDPPGLAASFTADDTTPCHDSLEGDSIVQFTDTSTGSITSWSWDLNGDGIAGDANVPNPTFDYDGFTAAVPVNVTLIVSNGSESDSFVLVVTPTDCL